MKVVSLLESRYDWTEGIKFMATAFITHADCTRHDMGRHHPESPARLAAIEDHLVSSGIAGFVQRHEAPAAKVSELARVHPIEYIEAIRDASPQTGIVHLDPDTAMCPHTWDAALRAAGAAVLANSSRCPSALPTASPLCRRRTGGAADWETPSPSCSRQPRCRPDDDQLR